VRNPISGAQFRRDVKLAQKRSKDMAKLRDVILLLIEGNPLPPRFRDQWVRLWRPPLRTGPN